MPRRRAAGRVVLAALATPWIAPAARASCADWNPLAAPPAGPARAVTAADLIGLVNFGRPDAEPVGGPSALAVSPDGRRVAVILQRADLPTNSYCQALVVLDPSGRAAPRVLDRGGDFLMTTVVFRGMAIPNGFPRLNAPAWSPDGRSVAYLRRDDELTRLWRVAADGGTAIRVTDGAGRYRSLALARRDVTCLCDRARPVRGRRRDRRRRAVGLAL